MLKKVKAIIGMWISWVVMLCLAILFGALAFNLPLNLKIKETGQTLRTTFKGLVDQLGSNGANQALSDGWYTNKAHNTVDITNHSTIYPLFVLLAITIIVMVISLIVYIILTIVFAIKSRNSRQVLEN